MAGNSADINDVTLTGTDYADNATIEGVWSGNGGSFYITGGSIVYQLQYPPPKPAPQKPSSGFGDAVWSDEHQLGTGPGTIPARVTGIRFKNVDATNPATVTAAIAGPGQPILTVSAPGTVASAGSSMITGQVAATGAITAGTGFTVAAGGSGAYTITFTTPFAAPPTVLAICGPTTVAASRAMIITSVTANQVALAVLSGANQPFNFVAYNTV